MSNESFETWNNGSVSLKYARVKYIEGNKPKLVSWDDFSNEDEIKIKEKQKEIFKQIVSTRLELFKIHFIKKYKQSSLKGELLKLEKKECKDILSGPYVEAQYISSRFWNVLFELDDLLCIQNYYKETILGGADNNYDFIQSLNDIHQEKSKTLPEVYARFVFECSEWLNNKFKYINTYNDKTEENWFKVGILFANGEMDLLLEKHKNNIASNCSAISRELGNTSFRNIISESKGLSKSNKNIFIDSDKVQIILDYCKDHDITVVDTFYQRIKVV